MSPLSRLSSRVRRIFSIAVTFGLFLRPKSWRWAFLYPLWSDITNPSAYLLFRLWSFCDCNIIKSLIQALMPGISLKAIFYSPVFSHLNYFKIHMQRYCPIQYIDNITSFLHCSVSSSLFILHSLCSFWTTFLSHPHMVCLLLFILNVSSRLWCADDTRSLPLVFTSSYYHLSHAYPHVWKELSETATKQLSSYFRSLFFLWCLTETLTSW